MPKFRELMKSLVPWPFRQTGRLKICAYCGLRASAFGFPWPAADVTADYIIIDVERLRRPMQKITDHILTLMQIGKKA
ncbi:MAG: hypothetical protein GY782_04665 [Gammaproteobacteria bacterium]|nr:hypothetical protein [Gammaproteobacteria bacterium]